jgi:hypothetical protein
MPVRPIQWLLIAVPPADGQRAYLPLAWLLQAAASVEAVAVTRPADLLAAAWEALAASTDLETAFGRPAGGTDGWLRWPEEQADLPLAVLSSIDLSSVRRTFTGMTLRTDRLVVSVYATPKTTCQDLGDAVRAALAPVEGYARLAYSNAEVDGREVPGGRVDRTPPGGPETLPERDRFARTVYLYRVLFDLQLREWPTTGA